VITGGGVDDDFGRVISGGGVDGDGERRGTLPIAVGSASSRSSEIVSRDGGSAPLADALNPPELLERAKVLGGGGTLESLLRRVPPPGDSGADGSRRSAAGAGEIALRSCAH